MTTGGALIWETNSVANNRFFNSRNQDPVPLGIFVLTLVGFDQRMNGSKTVLEVNSTATATNVQLANHGVTLNCSESSGLEEVQAVLIIGKQNIMPCRHILFLHIHPFAFTYFIY